MRDPLRIGMVTQVDVRLVNRSPVEIAPVFAVPSAVAVQPIQWDIVAGPKRLRPGTAAVETIEAPLEAAVSPGEDFAVNVRDAGLKEFASSPPVRAGLAALVPVANPAFEAWTFDTTTGDVEPVGWTVAGLGAPVGAGVGVRQATVAGRRAVVLRLGRWSVPHWRAISLQQYLRQPEQIKALFAGGLTMSGYPTFRYTPGYGPYSRLDAGNAFGFQMYADGRWLWIVLSDAGAGWYVEPDAAVIVVTAPLNRWTTRQIPLRSIYRALGWTVPRETILGVFAATKERRVGEGDPAVGSFSGVQGH